MSRRTEKVGEQLRAEMARVLREEVADPRVALVTLLRVDVAADLGVAHVFWSHLDPNQERDTETVAEGLESATPYLRRKLAACLGLRRMPELHFRHDPSIEEGSRTLAILRELREAETVRETDGET